MHIIYDKTTPTFGSVPGTFFPYHFPFRRSFRDRFFTPTTVTVWVVNRLANVAVETPRRGVRVPATQLTRASVSAAGDDSQNN